MLWTLRKDSGQALDLPQTLSISLLRSQSSKAGRYLLSSTLQGVRHLGTFKDLHLEPNLDHEHGRASLAPSEHVKGGEEVLATEGCRGGQGTWLEEECPIPWPVASYISMHSCFPLGCTSCSPTQPGSDTVRINDKQITQSTEPPHAGAAANFLCIFQLWLGNPPAMQWG